MAASTRSASSPPSEESVHTEILALEAELTTIAKLRHTTKAEVATLQERLRQLKARAAMWGSLAAPRNQHAPSLPPEAVSRTRNTVTVVAAKRECKMNPKVQQALKVWLGMPTWVKREPYDDERFYGVVHALWDSSHTLPNLDVLRTEIRRIVREQPPNKIAAGPEDPSQDRIEDVVTERLQTAELIISYLLFVEGGISD